MREGTKEHEFKLYGHKVQILSVLFHRNTEQIHTILTLQVFQQAEVARTVLL